jgi:outer membrane protein assembly factor BamE
MTSLCLSRAGAAALLAGAALTGCQSLQTSENFLGILTPYRVEVVQGNVITSEQAAQARPGLSRAQVRDVLGSPLLADPFHADRWDYVFTIRRQGAEPQLRRIVILFKNDVLASIEGGADLPSERDFVASIDPEKAPRNPPTLALTEEQIKALPVPQRPPAPEPVPPAPARSYPPLEQPRS